MPEPLVRSFKLRQEVIEYLAKQEREAAAAMQPWQAALRPGDRVAYGWQYEGGVELTIYFEVLRDNGRGYKKASRMYGRGFSQACPDGELGTMWRCNALIKVTPVAWEAARCQGWPYIDFAGKVAPDGAIIEGLDGG